MAPGVSERPGLFGKGSCKTLYEFSSRFCGSSEYEPCEKYTKWRIFHEAIKEYFYCYHFSIVHCIRIHIVYHGVVHADLLSFGVYSFCWQRKGRKYPRFLSGGRYLLVGPGKVSAYIISSLSDCFKEGKFMNLLDDLYFYLWDKFLRISLRICGWIDDALGFDIKDPDPVASTQPEDHEEGEENGD